MEIHPNTRAIEKKSLLATRKGSNTACHSCYFWLKSTSLIVLLHLPTFVLCKENIGIQTGQSFQNWREVQAVFYVFYQKQMKLEP